MRVYFEKDLIRIVLVTAALALLRPVTLLASDRGEVIPAQCAFHHRR
jgi:hypothetical protein